MTKNTKIHTIEAGTFKLDGGAMFGVVPKKLWNRLNPADDQNLCTWALRCLLVEIEDRVILIDTGMGNKQDDKFFGHYEPDGTDILHALIEKGFSQDQITDVLLTHFHFDHVGGALYKNAAGKIEPTFPNATYWTNQRHYDWAYQPNAREAASFLKENFVPLREEGILQFADEGDRVDWIAGIQLQYVHGHTEAQMLPIIPYEGKKLIYCADLIPSSHHIGLPYIMAYDVRPLLTLEEKNRLLYEAADEGHLLYFEHDPLTSAATVKKNEKGRIILNETFNL